MSMHTIFRRYAPIAFTLTVAGSALAEQRGYRDMLARSPAHSADARGAAAMTTGYRNTAVLGAHAVTPRPTVAVRARGYRDLHVRFGAPSFAPPQRIALR
ncbi:MAG TPA: hypothetical protein VGQ57_12185 [Polyangiaceae bacterium]|jgi:hypothetical protein|nr:hypothetical protein [Polyangiaceae bacterium]